MGSALSKKDLLRIMNDPSPEVRYRLAEVLFREFDEGCLTESETCNAAAIFSIIVDDPDRDVRKDLSNLVCRSQNVFPEIVATLACNEPEIAEPVLKYSPVLEDDDLVCLVRTGSAECQLAIASRETLSVNVTGALVEIAGDEVLKRLIENEGANIKGKDIVRLIERFGGVPHLRDTLLGRGDAPASLSCDLMTGVSGALRRLMIEKYRASPRRALAVVNTAVETGMLDLVRRISDDELEKLANKLLAEGRMTPRLVLRSASAGHMRFVEIAISLLSHLPRHRVRSMIHGRGAFGLRAIYAKARLPNAAFPLFRIALETYHELARETVPEEDATFHRRIIERVLTRYKQIAAEDAEYLLGLLNGAVRDARRTELREMLNNKKAA